MVKWDIRTACEKVLKYFIDKRNNAPQCVVCDAYLYDYFVKIHNYLYLLEVKYRKIDWGMNNIILDHMYLNYPYKKDKELCHHHVNYAKNIQVPSCKSCHAKIHGKKDSSLHKWLPVDKRPKDQNNFDYNLFKPLD